MFNLLPSYNLGCLGKDKYDAECNWYLRLSRIADQLTHWINHVETIDYDVLKRMYTECLESMVYDDPLYRGQEQVELPGGHLVVMSKRMHLMTELFRIKALLSWTRWLEEHHKLKHMYQLPANASEYDLETTKWHNDNNKVGLVLH